MGIKHHIPVEDKPGACTHPSVAVFRDMEQCLWCNARHARLTIWMRLRLWLFGLMEMPSLPKKPKRNPSASQMRFIPRVPDIQAQQNMLSSNAMQGLQGLGLLGSGAAQGASLGAVPAQAYGCWERQGKDWHFINANGEIIHDVWYASGVWHYQGHQFSTEKAALDYVNKLIG